MPRLRRSLLLMTLRHFLKFTPLGRIVLIPYRFLMVGLPCVLRQLGQVIRWTFTSREHYNHTYALTDLNLDYLASFVAVISGQPPELIGRYIQELEADEELRALLRQQTLASPWRHSSDAEPRYGRRSGWYALVRATRPRVVVETGVDRGLGTVVLAAALKRNAAEGYPGVAYATDILPECGHLLSGSDREYCRILLGDSVETLRQFPEPVDLFIHDSDHRPEYEWAEFLAIESRLHPSSIILSDNSHESPKLAEFARRRGMAFLYFQDQPRDHWWPGDGIGAGFVLGKKTVYQSSAPTSAGGTSGKEAMA